MDWKLAELAKALKAELRGGDGQACIRGVAPLESATSSELAFMSGRAHRQALRHTQAGGVLISEEWAAECPVPALVVGNPHASFARAIALLHPPPPVCAGIHPSAVVHPRAQIAHTAHVGPLTYIGPGCTIEEDVVIGPGCSVMDEARIGRGTRLVSGVFIGAGCIIGERCLIHPGAVIGADGFGLAKEGERWIKVPQIGRVRIGDDVEIGANTTIDRGALEDTVIEDGVKLDNQIQVAHNVRIGAHTAIAGCVGIAGSAVIGRECTIGGGVGIAGHLTIADKVHVTGMSLVAGDLPKAGAYSSSLPAQSMRQWQKNAARLRHLDDMARRIRQLEAEILELKAAFEAAQAEKTQ